MLTFNITFIAYDDYTSNAIMGTFASENESPTQEEINRAVKDILISINWLAASIRSIVVYKA